MKTWCPHAERSQDGEEEDIQGDQAGREIDRKADEQAGGEIGRQASDNPGRPGDDEDEARKEISRKDAKKVREIDGEDEVGGESDEVGGENNGQDGDQAGGEINGEGDKADR